MAQLVRFDPNHDDLIADMEFDIYGNRLCTVSSDHTIKVWQRCTGANTSGQWQLMSSWKGHDSSLTKVSWAHPEFGNLIATGSFDRTVRIWQQRRQEAAYHGTGKDAQGMIVDLAFAPHFMGLQLAAASSDGVVRIYETGSPVKFDTWSLLSEIDSNAFQEVGNNLCISWCPTRFLTNTMAVGCGREKDAKIYRFAGGRWVVYEVLEGHTDIVHSISWAPQVGRSYHLVATACRDTYVRIYRVDPSYSSDIVSGDSNDLVEEYEAAAPGLQLNATLVASFNDHGAEVWSVSWNVTGTILSSSGDDGKVRLWKGM
ncbi:WD40-repeat-containing domain protein [Dimargaris cristalligena]|uniref:WD40-repeat-containing domain protein n=1 Tax=Dimargaris cristalligena TaxID=215637 RepID=A0A4P9ZPG9_9FUNG|nr:WD40-repeat-containing domain protein [Dimargaris cristalligena]|eukprot:RKP35135.1 WD40-repeat-containing domain protein [Dimargaris cristalligena]